MIPVPSGVRVWLAVGRTDMRKGMNGLALQVQEALGRDPHAGDLYVFRGARGGLIKIIWHDGVGMSLYAKRLEHGRFVSYGLCQRLRASAPLRLLRDGCWKLYAVRRGQGAEFMSTVAQALMRGLGTP
jgi:IS66 Orf2 like protein